MLVPNYSSSVDVYSTPSAPPDAPPAPPLATERPPKRPKKKDPLPATEDGEGEGEEESEEKKKKAGSSQLIRQLPLAITSGTTHSRHRDTHSLPLSNICLLGVLDIGSANANEVLYFNVPIKAPQTPSANSRRKVHHEK